MSAEPEAAPEAGTTYAYRPKLLGAAMEFRLTGSGIDWTAGRHSGHVPFRDIRLVRMSYKPATLQPHRFVTEVWADRAPKLNIVSASWKSAVEQERLDGPYAAFIVELHRRLAASGVSARLEHGKHPVVYWLGVAVFVMLVVAFGMMVVRGFIDHGFGTAAVIAGFVGLFGWYGYEFLRRNWPGRYRADALPPQLIPRG